ncbi:MAG: HYR domain-containing protein [Bacteroidetes bacterium]|nr:HYR domain-containing protein [Bacteroidota bacterium]
MKKNYLKKALICLVIILNVCYGSLANQAGNSPVLLEMPVPQIFNVTGGGGVCQSKTGAEIGLDGSETGVGYQLLRNGDPIGGPVAGTGFPISFGLFVLPGTYSVLAIEFKSQVMMNGYAVIQTYPLPDATITGSTTICAGDYAELHVNFLAGTPPFSVSINYNAVPQVFTGITVNPFVFMVDPLTSTNYSLNWVSDGNGCTNNQLNSTAYVTVLSTPAVNCPDDIAIPADYGECSATIFGLEYAVTSNCSSASFTYQTTGATVLPPESPSPGSVFNIGTTTVIATVTDGAGHSAVCSFDVIVIDMDPPQIICPDDMTVTSTPGQCGAVVIYSATATDNCSGVSVSVQNGLQSGSFFAVGVSVIALLATDGAGNTSTCTFSIMVNDVENPVITCLLAAQIPTDPGQCGAVLDLPFPPASDNCSAVVVNCFPLPGSILAVGTSVITWVVADLYDNTASCTQQVSVIDAEEPVIICPADYNVDVTPGQCGAYLTYPVAATDNCGGVTIQISGPPPGSFFPLGYTEVSIIATDAAGNQASCSFSAQVSDNEPPEITVCPPGRNVPLNVNCQILVPDLTPEVLANDNCGIVSIVQSPAPGTLLSSNHQMAHTVVITVTDFSGNQTHCTVVLTANDMITPVAICQNKTVYLNLNGQAMIQPADVDGGSFDNCLIMNRMVTPNTFSCANIGQNTVTLRIIDGAGNIGTCQAIVTVVDPLNRVAICHDIVVYLDDMGIVTITPSNIDNGSWDNCGISSSILDRYQFGCNDLGDNVVTLTVFDFSGNSSSCQAVVTVLDNISPTAVCQDINVYLDATGSASIGPADVDGGSHDNCQILSRLIDKNSFGCNDIGVNTVSLTVIDQSGNLDICSSQVNVVDAVDPVAICQDVTVWLDANGDAYIDPSDIDGGSYDNCGTIGSYSIDISHFDCLDVGDNTVTLTVTDLYGNSDYCLATVTVEDNIQPAIICPGDITVPNDVGTCDAVILYSYQVTDNCPGVTVTLVNGYLSGSSFPVGTTNVVLMATDASGNIDYCSFTVTVNDVEPPVIISPAPVTLSNDPGICGTFLYLTHPFAADNCPIVTVTPSQSGFFQVGTTTIIWTATDNSSNTATSTQDITINDVEPPVILFCPGDISITAMLSGVTSGPGVGSASGTLFKLGVTTVTYIVTDASGNTASCSFTVTVNSKKSNILIFDIPADICSNHDPIPLEADPPGGIFSGPGVIDNTFYPDLAGSGVFEITYTYENLSTGCVFDGSYIITVHPAPVITVNQLAPRYCCGSTVLLYAQGADTYLWEPWFIPDNPVSVTPDATTTYIVTGYDEYGCYGTASVTINIVPCDWGDAPDQVPDYINGGWKLTEYHTARSRNGASHFESNIYFNPGVDYEPDGQPSEFADGDDANVSGLNCLEPDTNDEHGVMWTPIPTCGGPIQVHVGVSTFGDGIYLQGWFDFNANGIFGDDIWDHGEIHHEQVFKNVVMTSSDRTFNVEAPSGSSILGTYARFRYSTQFDLGPDGPAPDGEVEDHLILPINTEVSPAGNGQVVYTGNDVMYITGTPVDFYHGEDIVYQVVTDSLGRYQVYDICPGIYILKVDCDKPWGGVNSADAMLVLKHFTGISPLTGLRLLAADVNGSGFPNGVDALRISKRFVGAVNNFVVGDWLFESDTVEILSDESILPTIRGICYGDVNASYNVPYLKHFPDVILETKGRVNAEEGSELVLPVSVAQNTDIGALSLVMNYSSSIDILDVTDRDPGNGFFVYLAKNGQLRISWYDIIPRNLKAGDNLLSLKIKINRAEEGDLAFALGNESVLSDENGQTIPNTVINLPKLISSIPDGYKLDHNIPNPFSNLTVISYTLAEEGMVSLKVYNLFGEEIAMLVPGNRQKAGSYQVNFDGTGLAAGVYVYKIEVTGDKSGFTKARRMILER